MKLIHLTKNDKKVLSLLLDDARMTDTEIALQIGITPQGARKIRLKLEENHIKEYRTIVDYKVIGLSVFAIMQLKVVDRTLLKDKHIIGAFEINESKVTHMIVLGFRNLEQLDLFKKEIKEKAEIQKIDVLSNAGLLRNSPVGLVRHCIDNI